MNKKNTIITILVLIILILGYYCFSKRQEPEEMNGGIQSEIRGDAESYLALNQECLKRKDEIAKKLETKESSFGKSSLEQIFYSPKENSCLYVEYSFTEGDLSNGEYAYSRRLFDISDDGHSSHPLADCYSLEVGDDKECKEFDKMLEEYK